MAAGFGARVALAESGRLGGTCVNVGCVPKKLLVYGSELRTTLADMQGYGWQVEGLTHYPELMWLHRNPRIVGLTLCLVTLLFFGFSGMAIGVLLGAAMLVLPGPGLLTLAVGLGMLGRELRWQWVLRA